MEYTKDQAIEWLKAAWNPQNTGVTIIPRAVCRALAALRLDEWGQLFGFTEKAAEKIMDGLEKMDTTALSDASQQAFQVAEAYV